jgi:FMN phosphatase YigB (HAD superfamily)
VRHDAVTFDFWNTLCVDEHGTFRGRRLAAWEGLLEDAGFAIERQRLDAVFDTSWERFMASWHTGEQYVATNAAEDILEELGYDVPGGLRVALIESFTTATHDAEVSLTEHAADAIESLRSAGLRVGIVCDVGLTPSVTLRSYLERHGVLELFDHWSFSDEVGVYKPDPRIFRHALAGLGDIDPARCAHVGDLRRTDVAGALGMGMTAVRYTGVFDDPVGEGLPEAHHVVPDHADLPALLAA